MAGWRNPARFCFRALRTDYATLIKQRKNHKRPLGFLRGEIWMAPDFNAPLKLVEDSGEMVLALENQVLLEKSVKQRNLAGRESVLKTAIGDKILCSSVANVSKAL